MTILLTGAGGFVGAHARRLLHCVPLPERGGAPVDLCDAAALEAAVRQAVETARPRAVLHLAAQTHVPTSFEAPEATYRANFLGTYHLLEALKRAGFRGRMLYAGSGDVYGQVPPEQQPVDETRPPRPRSPYAVSKAAAEALCIQWSQTGPFEVILARPFNHVGAGQPAGFVLADFARQIAAIARGAAPPVVHVGDVEAVRDFTDVADVVRAYELLLAHGANGGVYNVCSGVGRRVGDVLAGMLAHTGITAEVRPHPDRLRSGEQRAIVGSPARLQAATGWRPAVAWSRTLETIVQDWMEREG